MLHLDVESLSGKALDLAVARYVMRWPIVRMEGHDPLSNVPEAHFPVMAVRPEGGYDAFESATMPGGMNWYPASDVHAALDVLDRLKVAFTLGRRDEGCWCTVDFSIEGQPHQVTSHVLGPAWEAFPTAICRAAVQYIREAEAG